MEKRRTTEAYEQPPGPIPANPVPRSGERAQSKTIDSSHAIEVKSESDKEVGTAQGAERPGKQVLAAQEEEKKAKKSALTVALRDAFYTLCGWRTSADVLPMQRGEGGQPTFWTTDPQGEKRLTPAWNLGFDANWDEWGPDYLEMFRQKAKGQACASYLASLEDAEIQHRLRTGAWATCNSVSNRKSKGTYEEGRKRKAIIRLGSKQRANLLKVRLAARTGTCLESEEFDFLFVPCAQSPEVSDAEDDTRVIRREPRWFAPEIAEIKSALDQKSGVEPRKQTVVYVKHDVPMREPGNGKRYPYWAIDKQWVKDYPGEFTKVKFLIDMNTTVKPDTSSLTGNPCKFTRKYLENASAPGIGNDSHGPATSSSVQPGDQSTLPTLTDGNASLPPMQTFLLVPAQASAYPNSADAQVTHIDPRLLAHPQLAQAARVAYASYSTSAAHHPGQSSHQPTQQGLHAQIVRLPVQPAAQPPIQHAAQPPTQSLVEHAQPTGHLGSPVAPLILPDSRFAEAFVPPTIFPL
ncbi:hypothetical protein FRC08_000678 [Ceratobasidium sp. 394]|nr:hypothetical protein FRC08_000678 [Ceratobasidium sp. 394]